MKKCPNCGNEAESKFCTECGTQMVEIQDTPAEPAAESTDAESMAQEFEQFEGFQSFEIPSETAPTDPAPQPDVTPNQYNAAQTDAAPSQNNAAQTDAAPDPFSANTSTYTYAPSGDSAKDNFKKSNQEYQTYQAYQPPQKQGVSHRTWFVVLFLLIFWPVGLYLMWSRKKFTKVARIIITIIIGLLVALNVSMVFLGDNSSNDTSSFDSGSSYTFDSNSDVTAKDTDVSSSATTGEQNALKKAYSYLDFMAFSYTGLIEQLEYEGFTNAEATYAVDHCGADWNQQAAKKAKEYLDYSSFSRQGLIDQLEFEGFTPAQAVYGVNKAGL